VLLVAPVLVVPRIAQGQVTTTGTSSQKSEERPTGLPQGITWTFNLDAGWGTFGFANSSFDNPKEEVEENLSDQWFEGYVKPALSGVYTTKSGSEIYGKVSVVGERTYASVPAAFGQDVSSFGPEDLYIGWRSGQALGLGENALDFTVGRAQYRLGHGFLLWDGAAEGGSRGGYWTNARKAFALAAVGRFKPEPHALEAFYLDKDELFEADSRSRLWGANYEFSVGEKTTFGATYMKWFSEGDLEPARQHLNVYNLRAFTGGLPPAPDLFFEFEYAAERNGDLLHSDAWTILGGYELSRVGWTPKFSYRYASFEGDDPETARLEAFDPLFLGFYDWGTWWQGEIAGEYFLSNSNLISHLARVHVAPSAAIGAGVLLFKFRLDQPATFAPDVTSKDVGFEADLYIDWEINQNFTASLVLAYANPDLAIQQVTGRTENFRYGMLYLGYSY
jgi:hypothetical protein